MFSARTLLTLFCLVSRNFGIAFGAPINNETVVALNNFISELSNDTDNDDDPAQAEISQISADFKNKRTFACPLVKDVLLTGTGIGDLSPEDIDIVGALGDSLASGRGLWPGSDLEFRGAAFPIGGDEAIDGLVTIPNTLLKFKDSLFGTSHGMGGRTYLPEHQLNIAQAEARTTDLPEQATELIRRIHLFFDHTRLKTTWAFITIAIGTEEVEKGRVVLKLCDACGAPSYSKLRYTLNILRKGLPRALIVLLGPVKFADASEKSFAILQPRCPCFDSLPRIRSLYATWAATFADLQNHFNELPDLDYVVASREPATLFVDGKAILNRKGHTYAGKWLWNRLIKGATYTVKETLANEPYLCPQLSCPYLRTPSNEMNCLLKSLAELERLRAHDAAAAMDRELDEFNSTSVTITHHDRIRSHLSLIVAIVVVCAFISVSVFGTIIYRRGLKATKGRFEQEQQEIVEEK